MKTEVIVRLYTYEKISSNQTLNQYIVLGKLEVENEDELTDLKTFIQAGIRAYEDEHPRI